MVPETLAVVQLECGGLDEGEESSADVAVEGWEGRCWKGNIGRWSGCSCSCVGGVVSRRKVLEGFSAAAAGLMWRQMD